MQQVSIGQPLNKDSFSCGTSADVAHADKKDLVFVVDHFAEIGCSHYLKFNQGWQSVPLVSLPCASVTVVGVSLHLGPTGLTYQ